MSLLKKRSTAIVLAVVLCAAALVLGNLRSVSKLSSGVTQMFYDGVIDEAQSYVRPSIDSQLRVCADAMLGRVTVARNYDNLRVKADALDDARVKLIEAKTVAGKSAAYGEMIEAFSDLYEDSTKTVLTERDIELLNDYGATLHGARTLIAQLSIDYNEQVSNFPKNLFGIHPDYFDGEYK
jgi:hypothetical protein